MALWKDQSNTARTDAPRAAEPTSNDEVFSAVPDYTPVTPAPSRAPSAEKESVIGADLSIEGTISGNGNVRLAGRFTGDVTVDGNVSIEPGAKLAGGVRATTVTIAGDLEGNVVQATRVDVLASGALVGDLKADTLTIAAGSRVRGHIDCGWVDAPTKSRTQSNSSSNRISGSSGKDSATSPSLNGAEAASTT